MVDSKENYKFGLGVEGLSMYAPCILKALTFTPWKIHRHFTVFCSPGVGNLNQKCQVFPAELPIQELYL